MHAKLDKVVNTATIDKFKYKLTYDLLHNYIII